MVKWEKVWLTSSRHRVGRNLQMQTLKLPHRRGGQMKSAAKNKRETQTGCTFPFHSKWGVAKKCWRKTKVQVCGDPLHNWGPGVPMLGGWECPAVTTKKRNGQCVAVGKWTIWKPYDLEHIASENIISNISGSMFQFLTIQIVPFDAEILAL